MKNLQKNFKKQLTERLTYVIVLLTCEKGAY